MKLPVFGQNKIQQFVEFFMSPFRIRVGVEGTRLFKEVDEEKGYIDSKLVNQLFRGQENQR